MPPSERAGKCAVPLLGKLWAILSMLVRITWDKSLRAGLMANLEKMRQEGVNVWSRKDRRCWIRGHRKEINKVLEPEKHQPSVHGEPQPGRNDPCLCGSSRKFKRCCGSR